MGKTAALELLRYLKIEKKVEGLEKELEELDELEELEYHLRSAGIMQRAVTLTGKWFKDGIGVLLASTREGREITLLPCVFGGYQFYDENQGKYIKITKKNEQLISRNAICFYKSLPQGQLSLKDLILYMIKIFNVGDYLTILCSTVAVSLLGLLLPYINELIFSEVIPSQNETLLLPAFSMLIGISVSTILIGITKSMILSSVIVKMNIAIESGTMSRILSLSANFFKDYSAGELAAKMNGVNMLCEMIAKAILSSALTSIFSFVYLIQIRHYSIGLFYASLLIVIVFVAFSTMVAICQYRLQRKQTKINEKLNGLIYGLFQGIQKIKLAGAEKRAFSKWTSLYAKGANLLYNPPILLKIETAITMVITSLGLILIYHTAFLSNIEVSDFIAFYTAYGMISGAMISLSGVAVIFAKIKPGLETIDPILKAMPETNQETIPIKELKGDIELKGVTFHYPDTDSYIAKELSLTIKAGEYIGIVGKTGCGKTTLLRLLLGFEKPVKGELYFDGLPLSLLDLRVLRKKIGVVMQGGKLFEGNILTNILTTNESATIEDAWRAAELAGIAEDIKKMPMGMYTAISEGQDTISGGQKQRIMLARVMVKNPAILLLDEATSALDNITQKKIQEALAELKCTRIVVAHRLSTIKECSRIIILEKGKIVGEGTYEDLLRKNTFFAELVKNQTLKKKHVVKKDNHSINR